MRLALLPGLLEASHAEGLRARRRRLLTADHVGANLMALKAADDTIDRVVRSCAIYGQAAHDCFEASIPEKPSEQRSAAAFLRLGLAVHTQSPDTCELATKWARIEPRAVLEAMWFFPAPASLFGADVSHVAQWFDHVAAHAQDVLPLAIELAGRADARTLRPAIRSLMDDNVHRAAARLALVRLGATDAHEGRADAPDDWRSELEIAACDPRRASEAGLLLCLRTHPDGADLASAILAARQPRLAVERLAEEPVSLELRCRVIALTGYVDGVVAACAAMAESSAAITPSQRDVLELALGGVPAEVRVEPSDPSARSAALRSVLLKALRRAHVRLHNDADRGDWRIESIVVDVAQASKVRLRHGTALRDAIPAFGPATLQVTHGLRQWLYIERAATSGRSLSLSAMDVSRRQEQALMVAEVVDELRDR